MAKQSYRYHKYFYTLFVAVFIIAILYNPTTAQVDSGSVKLDSVQVSSIYELKTTEPIQVLSKKIILQNAAQNIAELTKFFSGTYLKDYGGISGLKTVSTYSLGAAYTGVVYNGIVINNMQNGQIDLGKMSIKGIQSLQAGTPAQTNTTAAEQLYPFLIYINTLPDTSIKKAMYTAGIQLGQWQLLNPYFKIAAPFKKNHYANLLGEYTSSKGNFNFKSPFTNQSEQRLYNQLKAATIQANTMSQLSSKTQAHSSFAYYNSDRSLPGSLIFNSQNQHQNLHTRNVLVQAVLQHKISVKNAWLFGVRYLQEFNRYIDSFYPNAQRLLRLTYLEKGLQANAGYTHMFLEKFSIGTSSNFDYTSLHKNGNIEGIEIKPVRTRFLQAVTAKYQWKGLQVLPNLTFQYNNDKNGTKPHTNYKNVLPSLYLQQNLQSKILKSVSITYKKIFRIPSFNELYFSQLNNSDLKPESGYLLNAQLKGYLKSLQSNKYITYSFEPYYQLSINKIIAIPRQNMFQWSMINFSKTQSYGFNVLTSAQYTFKNKTVFFTQLNYSFNRALDITNPQAKVQLPYIPKQLLTNYSLYSHKKWHIGYSFQWSGERYSSTIQERYTYLKPYFVCDFFGGYKAAISSQKIISISFGVNNATNTNYAVVQYYPMPLRSFQITLSFSNS